MVFHLSKSLLATKRVGFVLSRFLPFFQERYGKATLMFIVGMPDSGLVGSMIHFLYNFLYIYIYFFFVKEGPSDMVKNGDTDPSGMVNNGDTGLSGMVNHGDT
ncbi:hypothetical protein GDO81_002970 [Engystomops pustulosus]|uniref:Uncharacterized protein n=1 Tax=Engystomops pustulosus TaxID=76066 RepID=A0AAV7DQ04_ENGPU|nr:hypothetical protein GDO81_002970 [Engystomops pustulosus]